MRTTTKNAAGERGRSGSRIVAALIGAVVLAVIVASCGSDDSYSEDINDYIPDDVEGKEVDKDSEDAAQFVDGFELETIVDVTGAAVQKEGDEGVPELPEILLIAAEVDEDDEEDSTEDLFEGLEDQGAEVWTEDFDEVEAEFLSFDDGSTSDLRLTIGVARPSPSVILLVAAFEDGRDNAEAAMRAMLDAGSSA